MPDLFRLPRLKTLDRIVDGLGRPSISFVKFLNTDFAGAIERQEAAQTTIIAELAQAVADIQAAQAAAEAADAKAVAAQNAAEAADAKAVAAQTQIDDEILPQVTANTEAVQIAQVSTNATQAEVDTLSGSGAVSGSASNPAVDVSDGTWVLGPQVDLTGVVAGDLTITGSGPIQDSDVAVTGGSFAGQFRIVEVVSGVDEVLNTWSFAVSPSGVVSTPDSGSVADYVSARTSTGAVSYRIDARRASGTGQVTSLSLYVYARRTA